MQLRKLFNRAPVRSIPHELYGAVMAQSRRPVFFSRLGVADTVVGRADILALHMVLLGRRLAGEDSPQARALNQEVFDIYVNDLDRALRELGVGDTSVPKRKKRLVHGYYGQLAAFVPAIDIGDRDRLISAVAERFYDGVTGAPAKHMANYAMRSASRLAGLSFSEISRGRLEWGDPEQTDAAITC